MSWFDIEKIDPKTYIFSENKHYEKTNIYYLIGDDFNVCIDSGMGLHEIINLLDEIDPKEKRVITSHSHWDHIGNHHAFDTVYLHENAKKMLGNGGLTPLATVKQELTRDIDDNYIPANFSLQDYKLYDGKSGFLVNDGDLINIGNRELEIIYTPGHTNDSISVFDRSTGYLFVGDLLYSGTLCCKNPDNNPIDYYHSLKNLSKKANNITKVLSGHYLPDLGIDYLIKAYELFKNVNESGNLKQGTGIHQYNGIEMIL